MENEDKIEEKDLLMIVEDIISEIHTLDTMDQCVELLMSGLEKQGIEMLDPLKVKSILASKLTEMSPEERGKYLGAFLIEKIQQNESLFHILGPVHAQELSSSVGCEKYGGCRMFYCECFEFHLTDPTEDKKQEHKSYGVTRWFKGQCEKCCRKIPKRCYAVRCPLENGGWIGTYCSWNCLYLSGNGSENLISQYEKEMNDKKIIDREEM
jgi:hypothetical protein